MKNFFSQSSGDEMVKVMFFFSCVLLLVLWFLKCFLYIFQFSDYVILKNCSTTIRIIAFSCQGHGVLSCLTVDNFSYTHCLKTKE